MIDPEIIDDKNWILYAARYYNNPSCYDVKEFLEDIKRLKYVKKACTRYESTGELKEHTLRLVLNHIVILNNVFGPFVLSRLVFLRLSKQLYFVKPFMVYLDIWPDEVRNIEKRNLLYTDKITMDKNIIEFLRKI